MVCSNSFDEHTQFRWFRRAENRRLCRLVFVSHEEKGEYLRPAVFIWVRALYRLRSVLLGNRQTTGMLRGAKLERNSR